MRRQWHQARHHTAAKAAASFALGAGASAILFAAVWARCTTAACAGAMMLAWFPLCVAIGPAVMGWLDHRTRLPLLYSAAGAGGCLAVIMVRSGFEIVSGGFAPTAVLASVAIIVALWACGACAGLVMIAVSSSFYRIIVAPEPAAGREDAA